MPREIVGNPTIVSKTESNSILFKSGASLLQEFLSGLKKKQFASPALFIVDDGEKLHLASGKGGGKPDQVRGAAPDRSKIEEIKKAAKERVHSKR